LWRTELRSQHSSALVTLTGVPVHIPATLGTAPLQPLLFGPRVKPDLALAVNVLQNLTVMRKSVFAEVRQLLARKIRTFATVPEPLLQGTGSNFTVPADNGDDLVGEATIARQVLRLYRLALLDREHFGDLLEELHVASLASQAN
jgi:hypothetical protein